MSAEVEEVPIGPLRLRLKQDGPEIWVAWSLEGEVGTVGGGTTSEWERWATSSGDPALFVQPAFPDRTLVVAPEAAFNVAPGAEARIYVRIPLVATIALDEEDRSILLEIPTVVMSNTWWGDFVDGELCYWIPTSARREIRPEHFTPHLVVCPIQIVNRADTPLAVEKVAVRAAHLSIFAEGPKLWADETRVVFQDDEEGSEIEMSGRPPREAVRAERMAKPRRPTPRGFRARTFARLKSISGF